MHAYIGVGWVGWQLWGVGGRGRRAMFNNKIVYVICVDLFCFVLFVCF